MSLVDVDSWINEFESCERLSHSIQNLIFERNQENIASSEYTKLSAGIRIRLKQFENELSELKLKLNITTKNQSLTVEESERRLRQFEKLQSQFNQLQNKFKTIHSDLKTLDEYDDNDDEPIINITTNLNVQDLRQEQIRILEDQNKGLDALSETIARQKKLSSTFGQEVQSQNEILDDLADRMERIDARVGTETRNIDVVNQTDSTWGYWTVIIFLFIAIVVISFF